MSNPVGRPPKFESPEQLWSMFEEWQAQLKEDEIADVEGLCFYLDTARQTLFDYERKDEYSDTIKRIKDWIHYEKKQLAFKGKIPPAIFIFDAINNSDYRNKTESDVKLANDPDNPITTPLSQDTIDAFISTVKDATKQK